MSDKQICPYCDFKEKGKSIKVGMLLSFYDKKFKYVDGKLKRLKNEKHKD